MLQPIRAFTHAMSAESVLQNPLTVRRVVGGVRQAGDRHIAVPHNHVLNVVETVYAGGVR
jgi:hypothetical protein